MAFMITSTCDKCKKTKEKEWKGTLDHNAESFRKYYACDGNFVLCDLCYEIVKGAEKNNQIQRGEAHREASALVNEKFDAKLKEIFDFKKV